MSEANGKSVAVAAIRIHERYGVGFTRRLCAALDRLSYVETGERFSLSLTAPDGWLDPAVYPPDDVDEWSEPTEWTLAGPEGARYVQREVTRGPRKGQSGWYDSTGKKFMPAAWKPAGERKPKEKAPAKEKGKPPAKEKSEKSEKSEKGAGKPEKASADEVHDVLRKAIDSGKPVGREDVLALGRAIVGLKGDEIKALRAKLGLTKGSGTKQKLADELVAKVVAGGGTKKEEKADEDEVDLFADGVEEAKKQEKPKQDKGTHRSEAEWRAHPSLAPLGKKLSIRDVDHPAVQKHLEHLSRVPPKLAAKMADYLSGVYVGADSLTGLDDMGHLKGVQPRGWSEGSTWDSVAGAYESVKRKVIAGVGREGCASLANHEYAHGVDDALGRASHRADFRELHREVYDQLEPYFKQGGPGAEAGCQEMFAECFGMMTVAPDRAVKTFGRDVVDWMHSNVMGAP